jgi:hypothetical protein
MFVIPSSLNVVWGWVFGWLLDEGEGTTTQESLFESTLRIGLPL